MPGGVFFFLTLHLLIVIVVLLEKDLSIIDVDDKERSLGNTDRYIGKRIGNYEIVAEIAEGAFGRVFRARHAFLRKRTVAIKFLQATYLDSPEERERFLQEAQFLETLKHPHILSIYDVGINEGYPYLVAEYASNGSLRDLLEKQRGRPLSQEWARDILKQVGEALHFAHQQKIIHRDLKPENILFNTSGQALLADFGIATTVSTLSVKLSAISGTPSYMAPEQFQGTVSKRSDQYALGCIAYELFTGYRPFSAPDFFTMGLKHLSEAPLAPSYLNKKLPGQIEQAILRAISKSRMDRFEDIPAFLDALCQPEVPAPAPVYPEKIGQHLTEGLKRLREQRYTEALQQYQQVLKLDPHCAAAYVGKGNVLAMQDQYMEALEAYDHALSLASSLVEAYVGKGFMLCGLQRYSEAVQVYDHALELEPGSDYALSGRSFALEQMAQARGTTGDFQENQ